MNAKKHIALGISGGVDSAVAALLLKQQGHHVIALFMQNWEEHAENTHCRAEQDLTDARIVCDQIGIELHTVNFAKQYWDSVFSHCLTEFQRGRTPNPDVLCNKEIKFNLLLKHAKSLGADLLATGHYAAIDNITEQTMLKKPKDSLKDQTYFLYMLKEQQLKQSIFPLSQLKKTTVRSIAKEHRLHNANKKDSTGICFIGERPFKEFLSEYILAQPGNIESTDGSIIATHDGLMFYTIGQRKGLNIGGQKNKKEAPWYVISKDLKRNVLIVDQEIDNPLLYQSQLIASDVTWINTAPKLPLSCQAKIRYRQTEQNCSIKYKAKNTLSISFEQPQRAITPGQSIVFYKESICLGGGIIN